MPKEKIQDSTPVTTLSKTNGIIREALMLNPGKDEWRERLCKTLELWSCEDDSISIDRFCRDYGIPYDTLLTYTRKYEDIGKMYYEVKRRIGANRWTKAFNRQASEGMCLRDLHHWHTEWHEINKYHADLRKVEEQQNGIQVVYIKDTPDTGQVKPKPSKAIDVGE